MNTEKVEEMVETYLNGNISDFKRWLKRTSKQNIAIVIEILNNSNIHDRTGSEIVYRLLNNR